MPFPVTPFCLKLRDVADRGTISTEEMGCPKKYYVPRLDKERTARKYSLLAGDGHRFGVWIPADPMCEILDVPVDEFISTFEEHSPEWSSVAKELTNFWNARHKEHLQSLNTFVYASEIFRDLPGATIALSVL